LISAPVGAPLAAGDALQPLSLPADVAVTQPATSLANITASQPVTLPAVDVATSQPAALLEDKIASVPLLVHSTVPEIASAPLLACTAVLDFTSLPRSSLAAQFPGASHLQGIAGNTIPFGTSFNAAAADQWVPMPERGNHKSTLETENRISRPAPSQDRLHDAVFARSVARFSLTEEDGQPDDSSAPAEIENFILDGLPLKSGESFACAIDAVLAATLHKKD
jgi:hypothetical protein